MGFYGSVFSEKVPWMSCVLGEVPWRIHEGRRVYFSHQKSNHPMDRQKKNRYTMDPTRWAQKPVISMVISPLIGVKSPQLPNYFRPFIGVRTNSIYNWARGPTLYGNECFFLGHWLVLDWSDILRRAAQGPARLRLLLGQAFRCQKGFHAEFYGFPVGQYTVRPMDAIYIYGICNSCINLHILSWWIGMLLLLTETHAA